MEEDLKENKGESGDADKYDVLHKKDNEMTQFMQDFPELKERESA